MSTEYIWEVTTPDNTTYKLKDEEAQTALGNLGTASTKDVPTTGNASSSQVVMGNDTRLSDSRTPTSHTHGNIQNGGTLQTNDVAIANGDKLVVTDSSDSNKVARSSVAFDGSTTTKALTPKGTFETFLQSHQSLAAYAPLNSPALTGTPTAPTATSGTNTTQIATTAFVQTAIDNLPEPMVFRGSLGTGGTITALPVNGTAKVGDTYKVITAGTYASKSAKVGDTFICLTKTSTANTWELIPSGDEPSGTVTSVGVTNGGGLSVSGSPVTSSGTITISHADTSSQASVNNSGRTYIQDITLDTYGHVTGIASATETVTDTHRPIQVNGTQVLGNNTTALNLKAGSNVNLSNDSGTVTIAATVPTVNNATLTIQKNGTTVKTFTANASSDVTANITVPTKVSELTNDSGYTTNTGTVTSVATGAGLTGGTFNTSGTIKAYMKSETKATYDSNTITNTQNKQYAVVPDKTGYLSVNVPWENTWRGIQNNLTSDSTSDSLSAAQGKALANGSARDNTKVAKAGDTMTGLLTTNAGITTKESITVQKKDDVAWTSSSLPAIIMKGASDRDFKFKFSTEGKNVDVGWDWTAGDGAGAFFRAADASTSPGCFGFYARQNTTTSIDFIGYPDGKLIWNSRRVVTSTNNTAVGGTTTPVYVDANGNVTALSYTIAKSVPSNADFTNTTYSLTQDASDGHKITLTPSSGTAQTITIPDNNTWRPVQNNLTSDSTTDSLSAAQGKALANGSARDSTKLPLAGGTMTGDIIFNKTGATDLTQVQMRCGANDYGRIAAGGTSNAGYLEIATADDGNEPIYARQYTGVYTSLQRTATILDGSGNTSFPGKLTISKAINELLTGSGTTAQDKGSGVSPRYFPAKWYFNKGIATPADGDMVTIKIPCAGHDFGVFLSLDNGTTYKPIGLKTQDNGRLTTHYGSGKIITLVYDSTAVVDQVFAAAGADARSNITGAWKIITSYLDGNTYDRNVFGWTNIKAWGTALTAGNIIVGINGVFHHLKEGTAFDITYPILYLNANVGANGTQSNVYDCINFSITTTQSITLTQFLPVYIKGTLNGTIFTPVSTTPLTQTVPTSYDGYIYIELGIASSTTAVYLEHRHKILAFLNGKFGEVVNAAANWANYAASAGTASTARKIVNDTIRMTTADTAYSDAGLRYYLSSSSMTTHKPPEDGKILHMPWDYDQYASQLFIGHGLTPVVFVRSQNGATWGDWYPVGRFTQTAPTTGQVIITDGVLGGIKSSGYTIATSVPSGAVFTDAKVTQTPVNTNATYEVLFSGTADNSTYTGSVGKYSNLLFNPNTSVLSGPNEMRARDLSVSASNGTQGGISLYSSSSNMDNYGIYFRQTSNKGKHGYVQSDWATYFTMSNTDNRGWVFRRNSFGNVASINTAGNAAFNGSVTIGANEANTTGARMEFNSTNRCVDFVFV